MSKEINTVFDRYKENNTLNNDFGIDNRIPLNNIFKPKEIANSLINIAAENVSKSALKFMRNKLGVDTWYWYDDNDAFDYTSVIVKIHEWIYHLNPTKYKAHCINPEHFKKWEKDKLHTPIPSLSLGSEYWITYDSKTFLKVRVVTFSSKENSVSNCMYFNIYGKNSYKVRNEIRSVISKARNQQNTADEIYSYRVSNKDDDRMRTMRIDKRDMSTIYMNKDDKKKILLRIKRMCSLYDMFYKRGIPFKLGILLHGKPGTGKSSLARALASYFDLNLFIIDCSNIAKSQEVLIQTLEGMQNRRGQNPSITNLILLEDIDFIFDSRKNAEKYSGKMMDAEQRANHSNLLNFLDGLDSITNSIIVATTNDIDALDEAITRKGRFDIQVEMNGLTRSECYDMVKDFKEYIKNEDHIRKINQFIESFPENEFVNPSELQNVIVEYIMKEFKTKK